MWLVMVQLLPLILYICCWAESVGHVCLCGVLCMMVEHVRVAGNVVWW